MKPQWDEVYEYAKQSVKINIGRLCSNLPYYHKEEVEQEALVRVWKSYSTLDVNAGWKSFVSLHCRGAVLDYLKSGSGFMEYKSNDSVFKYKQCSDFYEDDVTLDELLGFNGVYVEDEDLTAKKINWDLLARLAAREDCVLIFAKWLIGYSIVDIADESEFCRERVGQQINEIVKRISRAGEIRDKWLNQIVFALGLSEEVGLPCEDNGWGWEYEPVQLTERSDRPIKNRKFSPQIEMFEAQ